MNLTKPQKLIYDMEKVVGGSISVICGSLLIKGKKDLCEIEKAVNDLYRLNAALRIHIEETDGEVFQTVSKYTEQKFKVLCFNDKTELNRYAEKYAKRSLDFYGNLCEINIVTLPTQYGLLIKLHHIIGDAWTLSLLGTQFNKLMNDETVEAFSYVDYLESENAYIQSKRYEKDKAFFIEQFKKCDEVTYINEKQCDSLESARKTFIIDKLTADNIKKYANENNTSAFMLFTAALAAYINRTKMNAENFYIGTAVLNRNGIKEQNTAGMFVNTAPMLIELDNNKSFAENLSSVENTAFSVLRHQKFNYGDVLSEIRKEYSFSEKLYDVLISYQNATVIGKDVETVWYHSGMQSESLQIHIDDRDNEGIYRIHYDYLTEKFSENEIEKLHGHICNLLFDAIENDDKKIDELNILSVTEKQILLNEFNNTDIEYSKDMCILDYFDMQVSKHPNKVAVIFQNTALTYFELKEMVQDYANKLSACGITENNIVAVHINRSYKLIAFQLAVLKIGAIFLPVDKRYPINRIEYMCNDCNVQLLISDELNKENIDVNIIGIDDFENTLTSKIAKTVANQDICYIIYTSGSTGSPKGCMLKGSGLVIFCKNNNTLDTLKSIDNCIFASVNSISFDYFIAESLLPITNGFSTVILDDNESTIQEQFLEVVSKNNINVVMTTPTRLKIYFNDKCNTESLKQLKCICTSGEPLSSELLEQMYSKSPYAQVYNPIGPSECSVWDIGGKLERKNGIDIHIGKPIANAKIYIVDKYVNLTPIGITGELCIAGDGVGAGYLNRPELTAEKFIDNPFGEGKLYKTGDLAYWREDGNIAYVGRNDFQVKIRGLRIELGEIENDICSIDGILQAVVVVRKNNEGRQLICAFYTGKELCSKDIRTQISKKLPKYMLPHIFTHLSEMPLTSSGKINRKALPEIDLYSNDIEVKYIAPKTPIQKELCNLIELVLNTKNVGLQDDFFDLGGDSLKAIEFVSKAHNNGIYFDLQNVFDYPNVKELSEHIEFNDEQTVLFNNSDFIKINSIADSKSYALVYSNTYSDIIEELKEKLPNILYVNMKDISEHIETGKNLIVNGCTKYINAKITKENLASIVYTSGTTGKSKGVMLSHNNFCSCMYGACCNTQLLGSSLLILPLHHTFGLVAGVFSVLFYGYTIHINKSLKKLSKDFENCKPQNLFAVPLIVETLYKNIWLTARNSGKEKVLKSLVLISNMLRKYGVDLRKIFFKSVISAFGGNLNFIICGGAPIRSNLIKEFDSFGITVLNGYGITECGPIVAVNRNKSNVVGSVGLPLCCNEVKIADDGEVLVKGDNVMLGYYNNEQENKNVFSDGWFKTGDIGKIDNNGYLYITGRKKNLIILSNGENIPAETIEQEIYTIPYVKECVVYGKDNIIVAEIYLDSEVVNAKGMIDADIQKINNRLPQNKNIGKFILRDTEFPKTTTKKIKRNYGG